MNSKIKIYVDSGGNRACLEEYYKYIEFFQFPYDSSGQKKLVKNQINKLASPSGAQWRDCPLTWEKANFYWNELPSQYFQSIKNLLEENSKKPKEDIRRDILHLDSAIKMNCIIFITSDYEDIASKKNEIKNICGIEIFHIPKESPELIEYIRKLIKEI